MSELGTQKTFVAHNIYEKGGGSDWNTGGLNKPRKLGVEPRQTEKLTPTYFRGTHPLAVKTSVVNGWLFLCIAQG